MKKTLLVVSFILTQLSFGQTPVYHHSFDGDLSSPDFNLGTTGISLTEDLNGNADNAAHLAAGHQQIALNIIDNKAALVQEGTISLWFKFDGTGASAFGQNKPLIFWSNGAASYSDALMLGLDSNSNKIRVASFISSNTGGVADSNMNFPYAGSGQWNHYTLSYKFGTGGYVKAYLNGSLIAQRAVNYVLPSNTSNSIFFTGFNNSAPSSLYGGIDEIKVFTESLTDAQIRDLYLMDVDDLTMPEPVLSHEFSAQFYNENFNLGENSSLGRSRHNTSANALNLEQSHTGVSVDFGIHKPELVQQGTYSFWYKHSGYTQTNLHGYKPFFNLSDVNNPNHFMLSAGFNSNNNKYYLYASEAGPNSPAVSTNLTYENLNNTWNHYTIVYELGQGGYVDFYINGQKLLRYDINYTLSEEEVGDLFFLGRDESFINYMYGSIDSIKIFDVPLTSIQVSELHNVTDTESLYYADVYYNLDENTFDLYRAFNLKPNSNTHYGQNIDNEANKAGYLNIDALSTAHYEINSEFNQFVEEDMTIGFAFKRIENNNSFFYNTSTIPLFSSYEGWNTKRLGLVINKSNNKLKLGLNSGYQEIDYTIAENTWYYAHIVVEDNIISVYINGELIHTHNHVDGFGDYHSSYGLYFGRSFDQSYSNSSSSFLVGAMDEIFVLGRAYTFDEIQASVQAYDPSGVLSVIDHQTQYGISVYPNPTQGELNFSEIVDVKIFDAQGRQILEANQIQSLDLSNQQPGIYIIQLSNNKGSKTLKAVRQ